MSQRERIVIVGGGVGGLAAAIQCAGRGFAVTVVERAAVPGGKMRAVAVAGRCIDAGPTVFTMRWVFDELFESVGASFAAHVSLKPMAILARHAWSVRERLDLFADRERSAAAIAAFASPAEGRRYLEFCARAGRIYATLEGPFLRSRRGNPLTLARDIGLARLGDLRGISPFTTMWSALGKHFHDPRLRQLFGRYATYCGSSPFLAPATLMLIAHVEQEGVWLVTGGMHRLAGALAGLAASQGASFRYEAEAREITVARGRVSGVRLATGEWIAADAVVVNADPAAVAAGLLGSAVAGAAAPVAPAERSLSALTWAMAARTDGFPLQHHNVFFSGDYAAEFDDIFSHARLPRAPTVYVCAQDRSDGEAVAPAGAERLLCLVNAPPCADLSPISPAEIEACERQTFSFLARCGLRIDRDAAPAIVTGPADFARLYPGTGGALYGRASHGWQASFRRPGARTRIPGLYLAGGSTHPGAGVPMAALSGRLAAASLMEDFGLTSRSNGTVICGGTSTV